MHTLCLSVQLQEWKKRHLRGDTLALVDWHEEELCERWKGGSVAHVSACVTSVINCVWWSSLSPR